MKKEKYQGSLDNALSDRRFYRFGMLLALAACIVLAGTVLRLSGKERTIIIPPEVNQSFWVDSENVSREYLEEMARYVTQLELTLTPDSFRYNAEQLLRYVHPTAHGDMRSEFAAREQQLQRDQSSTWFSTKAMTTDVPNRKVIVNGLLTTYVGEKEVERIPKAYAVEFAYVNQRLYLKTFKEVDTNAPSKKAAAAPGNSG